MVTGFHRNRGEYLCYHNRVFFFLGGGLEILEIMLFPNTHTSILWASLCNDPNYISQVHSSLKSIPSRTLYSNTHLFSPSYWIKSLRFLSLSFTEVSEATNTLGPGTMGLSTRYSPQFTLQHVPDYRQNVYIPGSTATLSANPQQSQQPPQALPAPQVTSAQVEPPKAQTPASKKKITKKEKK